MPTYETHSKSNLWSLTWYYCLDCVPVEYHNQPAILVHQISYTYIMWLQILKWGRWTGCWHTKAVPHWVQCGNSAVNELSFLYKILNFLTWTGLMVEQGCWEYSSLPSARWKQHQIITPNLELGYLPHKLEITGSVLAGLCRSYLYSCSLKPYISKQKRSSKMEIEKRNERE